MPRFFTHSQAEALLPRLRPLIERAIRSKAEAAEAIQLIRENKLKIAQSGGAHVNLNRLTALQDRQRSSTAALREILTEIEAFGVLVKDLDLGLLDFPTLYRNREVYLCWRAGENEIRFWHGTDEGFAGRKEIDDEFLNAHRGEIEQ